MRVITGTARGIRLESPEGTDLVRPTADRVKEAVFSAIQFDLLDQKILDLFAGSGQLGIEALSRGAKHCVFIDHCGKNQKIILENLRKTKLHAQGRVSQQNALDFLRGCKNQFDFIFLDPPYGSQELEEVLLEIHKIMEDTCKVICETKRGYDISYPKETLEMIKVSNYGNTAITTFGKKGTI